MDTRRVGMMVAFAVGSLIALQAVNGCSGTPRQDDPGTSAPDAGTTTTHPDAGTVVNPANDHTIGAGCTSPAANQQGDCATGLVCTTNTSLPGGLCTKACQVDGDCGTGAVTCLGASTGKPGSCLRKCAPEVIGSCNRTGYVCQPAGGADGVCLGDCNTAGACPGALMCMADGTCMTAPGNAGAYASCATDACQAGFLALGSKPDGSDCVCFPDCSGTKTCPGTDVCALNVQGGSKACLPNCASSQPCPSGTNWTCQSDGADKVCFEPPAVGTQAPGQPCGGTAGKCTADATCISTSATSGGICSQPCTADTGCTLVPSTKCTIQTQGGNKFCGIDCTAAGATCPTGTTCQASGATKTCLP